MNILVERILNGDHTAVITFYQEYSPKILRYLNQKLSHDDAEEIMQDVFLDALDELSLFRSESSIQTWLYTIAHNKLVDFYRKKKIKLLFLSQLPFLQIVANEVNEPEFQFEKNNIKD